MYPAAARRADRRDDDSADDARTAQRGDYVLGGMVKCYSGHEPLSMYGRKRKGHCY